MSTKATTPADAYSVSALPPLVALESLIRRAEAVYDAFFATPSPDELEAPTVDDWRAWRTASAAFSATREALDTRVRSLTETLAVELFTALESGDTRLILRAARSYHRMPTPVRRFLFVPHIDFGLDVASGEDCEPVSFLDAAIARRTRLVEGRESK